MVTLMKDRLENQRLVVVNSFTRNILRFVEFRSGVR